ncbi:hypothetical protein RHMOL_Rhmol01G0161400 [Rhododendron molle]|uniref:Uncharacterized protein n=1 Tax=Rhododendron molle TaxID=49168 RepID=A0ACC0Q5B6_RHOML|nr:hypothetical protein RHMOL_Rhmol01G0161400 [Rhododendron molle]
MVGNIKLNTDGCWYEANRRGEFGGIFSYHNAVNSINEGNPGNYPQSVVINEAHYLLNRTNTSLSHNYHSTDQCADHLACVGAKQDEDLVVLAKMPIFIREFVIRNSLNLMKVLD